jgi:hypothetical protein
MFTVLLMLLLSTSLSLSYSKWKGLAYNLSRIPTSIKGYALGARTAVRFQPISKVLHWV